MTDLPTTGGYRGAEWMQTGGNEFNNMAFLVRQIVAGKAFAALVIVRAVHGGGVGVPSTVDVQPLVNQVDGANNQIPHGTIYGLPCFRLQGGNGAVILDPVAGDIGQAIICDRDISTVKATGAVSPPGSRRQNDWSDGCYFGSFLGPTPTTYVQIAGDDINIVCAGNVSITSAGLTHNGVNIGATHVHSGVTTGSSDTGTPT